MPGRAFPVFVNVCYKFGRQSPCSAAEGEKRPPTMPKRTSTEKTDINIPAAAPSLTVTRR